MLKFLHLFYIYDFLSILTTFFPQFSLFLFLCSLCISVTRHGRPVCNVSFEMIQRLCFYTYHTFTARARLWGCENTLNIAHSYPASRPVVSKTYIAMACFCETDWWAVTGGWWAVEGAASGDCPPCHPASHQNFLPVILSTMYFCLV